MDQTVHYGDGPDNLDYNRRDERAANLNNLDAIDSALSSNSLDNDLTVVDMFVSSIKCQYSQFQPRTSPCLHEESLADLVSSQTTGTKRRGAPTTFRWDGSGMTLTQRAARRLLGQSRPTLMSRVSGSLPFRECEINVLPRAVNANLSAQWGNWMYSSPFTEMKSVLPSASPISLSF